MEMPSKENTIKILWGSVGTIIALVSAVFALDARYAHAEDVEKDKIATQRIILETTTNLRKGMVEDKLFELDIKEQTAGRLTPVDTALRNRYTRQLNELNRKLTR